MKPIITAYGEALWDLFPEGPVLGGAPFNFIYRVKGLGADAKLISRIGTDTFGLDAVKRIERLGFDVEYIQRDDKKPTGTVKVSFDEYKNPSYVIIPDVAYDYIENTQVLQNRVAASDCLCFGSLIQRSALSMRTLHELFDVFKGRYLLFDINLRKDCYTPEAIELSLKKSQITKLNEDELFELKSMFNLNGDTIREIADSCADKYHLEYCLVTLGDKGLYSISNSGDAVYVPGFKVDLVDPVGAGDACAAGFIHSLLTGLTLEEACMYANATGAVVAETAGATAPISMADIDRKLKESYYTPAHPEFVD